MRIQLLLLFVLSVLLIGELDAQVIDAPPPLPPPPPTDQREMFKPVEEMPRFPGCEAIENRQERSQCAEQQLLEYVYSHLQYPETAKVNGLEGTAVVSFVVEKSGTLSDIRIIRDPGDGLGDAAAETIHQMTRDSIRWIPATQRGKVVNVQFNMPVKFRLPEEKKQAISLEEPTFEDNVIEVKAPPEPSSTNNPPKRLALPADVLDPNPKPRKKVAPKAREAEIEEFPPSPIPASIAPPPPTPRSNNEDVIFKTAEQMPRYHEVACETLASKEERKECAQQEMLNTIYSNLEYPPIAKENGVEGTCIVTFVVEKDGSLSDIRVIRDIGAGCGKEVVRLVGLMAAPSKWVAGQQRGQNVRFQFNLPVKFRIE